jgi:hypothetical protein
MRGMMRTPRLRSDRIAIAILAAWLVVPAPVDAAGRSLHFELGIHESTVLIFGSTRFAGDAVLTVLTADGSPKARTVVPMTSSGPWYARLRDQSGGNVLVEPGDRLKFVMGSRTIHSVTVPDIRVSIARTSDVLTGRAPANASLRLAITACRAFTNCSGHQRTVNVHSDGTFRTDLTRLVDIRGGDNVTATWTAPVGDRIVVNPLVPYLRVQPAGQIDGFAQAGTLVTTRLYDSSRTLRGTASAIPYGTHAGGVDGVNFRGTFRSRSGNLVRPHVGDRVISSLASDASFTLPLMTAIAYASDDTVKVSCKPNRPLQLVLTFPNNSSATYWVHTDGAGNYQATAPFDISPNTRLDVTCKLASGDLLTAVGFAD